MLFVLKHVCPASPLWLFPLLMASSSVPAKTSEEEVVMKCKNTGAAIALCVVVVVINKEEMDGGHTCTVRLSCVLHHC